MPLVPRNNNVCDDALARARGGGGGDGGFGRLISSSEDEMIVGERQRYEWVEVRRS